MAEVKEIECSCGHLASVSYREKDSPYSSCGIWTFTGLDCVLSQVEKPVQMSYSEAVAAARPKCPACGAEIS